LSLCYAQTIWPREHDFFFKYVQKKEYVHIIIGGKNNDSAKIKLPNKYG
jgi:hypothetical protein